MEQYLKEDEQQRLKDMLYGYLKDKAARRQGVTSKGAYEGAEEQFVNQMRLRDVGALAGGLSEAASMVGQVQGKRAQSDIIPNVNKDLYGSTQGAYENFRTLRDQEERSNMNDLNVARYISQLEQANDANKREGRRMDLQERQYSDLEPRRQLEIELMRKRAEAQPDVRRRLQPNLIGPGGSPVIMDESGNPSELPGYKLRESQRPLGTMTIVPGYEADGKVLMRDAQGNLVERDLPTGFKKTEKPGSGPGAMNVTQAKKMGVFKIGEMAERQYQQAVQKGQQTGEWDPTSYSDWIDNARIAPNWAKNPAAVEAFAAMNSWVDTYLRDESGAAIPDTERAAYFKVYFPQQGDPPQAVQNKARLRAQKMQNAKEAAGASGEPDQQQMLESMTPRERLEYHRKMRGIVK